MSDVHIKLSDGVREINVEVNGSDDDPLSRAEAAAVRLWGIAADGGPPPRQAGFSNWALASETERSPDA